jgi:hypothetical protein
VPAQEEPVQPDYYGYYGGFWVGTDTKAEPMELPEDHPDVVEDSDEEDAARRDGADPSTAGGDNAEDGGDGLAAPDGGDNEPDDDAERAAAADVPPLEPHYEQELHHLDFAEGPFPALLWRAM